MWDFGLPGNLGEIIVGRSQRQVLLRLKLHWKHALSRSCAWHWACMTTCLQLSCFSRVKALCLCGGAMELSRSLSLLSCVYITFQFFLSGSGPLLQLWTTSPRLAPSICVVSAQGHSAKYCLVCILLSFFFFQEAARCWSCGRQVLVSFGRHVFSPAFALCLCKDILPNLNCFRSPLSVPRTLPDTTLESQ